jgi:hypothetical protein
MLVTKRLAGKRDSIQEGKAVGFEMSGRGLLFQSQIL